ncbi:MAG TPA: ferredoxin:thioredoxin reductase [Sediminispirochaeta sp.]|nr:ferredoxin:thioredoxin reductase [Sediminispirochaeta sp.]
MGREKSLRDILDFIDRSADHYGWIVNEDRDFVTKLAQGLLINYQRYGYLQCPCRDSWGDKKHDQDIVCPCTYCSDDIQEYGQCYCGLFLSPEFYAEGRTPTAIPERRPDSKFP